MRSFNGKIKFYGVVDSIEKVNDKENSGYIVTLDCLNLEQLNRYFLENDNAKSLLDEIENIDNVLLSITIPEKEIDKFLGVKKIDYLEGRWVKVYSTIKNRKDSIQVKQLTNFFLEEPINVLNYDFKLLNGRNPFERITMEKLKSSMDLEKTCDVFINDELAKEKLNLIKSSNHDNINVICYNVGQGNAICINEKDTDGNTNPLLYFDIGGGANFNYSTYQNHRTFNKNENTIFLLSHWDEDHYETARRDNRLLNKTTFIAPVQNLAPRNLYFVKKLIDNANLILVSRNFKYHSFDIGRIIRCFDSKNRKNNTGIALEIKLCKTNDINTILFPGDAQYKFRPNWGDKKFDAIMATHHGGKLIDNCIPNPNDINKGCIAYSYGSDNIYDHPLDDSVEKHENLNWGINSINNTNRLDTKEGDILFSWFFDENYKCNDVAEDESFISFEDQFNIRSFKFDFIKNL